MAMNLYTDPGNFQTIKVLTASKLSGISVGKTDVKHGSKVVPYLKDSRLPVLEVLPGKFLFSSNAATSYLLSKGGQSVSDEDQQWMEWEATQLIPVAVPYLVGTVGHGRAEKDLLQQFPPLLAQVDKNLKGQGHLVGSELCAADVVLFGTLYPLSQEKAFQGVMDKYPAVKAWVVSMETLSAVQGAVREVTGGKGVVAFKARMLFVLLLMLFYESLKRESLLSRPVPASSGATGVEVKPAKEAKVKPAKEAKGQSAKAAKPAASKPSTSDSPEVPMERVPAEEAEAAVNAWNTDVKKFPKPTPRQHPILPKKDRRNVLITSALPYVNNVPHLGNVIGCVLSADVFSRFCRLRNYNVLYICGTDEYGTATETKALEEGVTPKQICDKYNKLHSEIYQWFNIDFDYFGRTTTQQQTEIAQDIFWRLHERGFILKDSVEQLHCASCDKFLADRFVEGVCPLCGFDDARGDQCDGCGKLINATELKEPRCKLCQKTPAPRVSQHLFLDLPKLEPELKKHLDAVYTSGTWSSNARTITNSWIRDGLKPRCISRDLKWGTPVPLEGYKDKVFYVWFDAPIGYISITANYTDKWAQWWKNPEQVEMYNFLGKDNVPFHSVIFPSCLLGAQDNYTIVNHMVATEYLNYEDTKFSKSRGSGVFGDQAKDTGIPADIYRFYLLYVRPESQDTSFSWDDLLLKNNSEMLNNLGNFVNRALMFLSNNFGGVVQDMDLQEDDTHLLALITRELRAYIDNMDNGRLRDSVRNILTISRLGNQFMQANKPWVSVKGTPQEKKRAGAVVSVSVNVSCLLSVLLLPYMNHCVLYMKRAGAVVSVSVNVSCLLSVLLLPYMPTTSATIQQQLNAPSDVNVVTEAFVCRLRSGHQIGKPSPLFQKIEASTIADLKAKFAGKPAPPKAADKAKGAAAAANKGSGESSVNGPSGVVDEAEVARLTEEVTKQGIAVRELKTAKADKSAIDAEVAKLLDLKKRLALAQGLDTAAAAPSGGKKKGKKK
ncbi:hypothetical protein ACOMHN_063022 [Nucella lapillus]